MNLRRNIKLLLTLFKNIRRALFDPNEKITFIFNYHRIGKVDLNNPFHRLHTVGNKSFKLQIKLMRLLGKVVSLEEIYQERDLEKINFAITFDDISSTVLDVTKFLEAHNIPWAWGPSIQITENGMGWRDKVYFILNHYSEDELFNFVSSILGEESVPNREKFSFYAFSKSDSIHSEIMEKKIIDKLYEPISSNPKYEQYLNKAKSQNYLSWDFLRSFYGDSQRNTSLATLMNHSLNHYNLATLSRDQIFKDIDLSALKIREELNIKPDYFAVPFGAVEGNLLNDLNDALHSMNYKGVLWVTNSSNLTFKRDYPLKASSTNKRVSDEKIENYPQMLHLSRIHAPNGIIGFFKSIIIAMIKASRSVIDHSYLNESNDTSSEFSLISTSEPKRSLQVENLLRYGKDYSSSLDYYRYLFSQNIFKQDRDDYYMIEKNRRIESIGYNFHMKYNLLGSEYLGIYWAGWRKLSFVENNHHSMLLLKAMKEEPIIGSYKPNEEVKRAFRSKNWRKTTVNIFNLNEFSISNKYTGYDIKKFHVAPNEIDVIVQSNRSNNEIFTINRSKKYYQWRFDQYSKISGLSCSYYVLYNAGHPSSFLVALERNGKKSDVYISDFICHSNEDFFSLYSVLRHDLLKSDERGNLNIHLETSSASIASVINSKDSYALTGSYENFYYFNRKYFKNHWSIIDNYFEKSLLHETQATGDVLPR